MRTTARWTLASIAVLTLAGCGQNEKAEGSAAPEPSNKTLAATLNGEGDLDTLESVTTNSGLASVLEGVGPYTVFAPTNAAFEAGGGAAGFTGEAQKAEAAALLRAHIVPGALTRRDILAALDQAERGDGIEMRTMSDGLLTFARDGDAIVITTPDGARARLTSDEEVANNGVIQPVDGLLVRPTTTADPAATPPAP